MQLAQVLLVGQVDVVRQGMRQLNRLHLVGLQAEWRWDYMPFIRFDFGADRGLRSVAAFEEACSSFCGSRASSACGFGCSSFIAV